MKRLNIAATTFKWIGVTISLVLFLFWGAFFISHLSAWFLNSESALPPMHIWISMALHLLMLIGLAMTIKWDKLGVLITLIGTIAFFSSIGYRGFPYIALLNELPFIFLGMYWLIRNYECNHKRGQEYFRQE